MTQAYSERDCEPRECDCTNVEVSLLTGGRDKPYALGLASTLATKKFPFEFVGSDEIDGPELHGNARIRFLNLRGEQSVNAAIWRKIVRILVYYSKLICYATVARPKVFHILWNNKFEFFDRTLLQMYYRILGKRVVYTAHNVNAAKRDKRDSLWNRLTLKLQYHLSHHIFVHTERMKRELIEDFKVARDKVSVIPFGINQTVKNSAIGREEARLRLGLRSDEKAVLFFGNIAPYKGLEFLVEAMNQVRAMHSDYRLIIAGRPKGNVSYWEEIEKRIESMGMRSIVTQRIEYIPDDETEVFFKAADVLVLPYTTIFQSGVLFLGYNFGLPVIASDVGSLSEDIVSGRTGLICRPNDPADLAAKIQGYFSSELFFHLSERRADIRQFALERYSWSRATDIILDVYRAQMHQP